MQYPCDVSDPLCVSGSNSNYSVSSDPRVSANQLLVTMSPAGFQNLDTIDDGNGTCSSNGTCPWGGGADPNALALFQQYPAVNSDVVGDGLDFRGFTFPANAPQKLDTFIVKLDYKLTQNGNHSLFLKGHLENFRGFGVAGPSQTEVSQFPSQPANQALTNNSKGIFAGYTAVFSSTLINNLR